MSPATSFKKTRIAPTPSGYLHLGNVFSFILTTFKARQTGASILLRIDDMDQARAQDIYLQDIFDVLNFLELPWDDGPKTPAEFKQTFSQVHRLPVYHALIDQLQSLNKVFACSCSRSQLQQSTGDGSYPGTCLSPGIALDTPETNWRLITNSKETITLYSEKKNNFTTSLPHDKNFFIVRKKDGMPSYQLASLADDIHFGIDLIVRGRDLISSSIAQRYLANQLPPNSFQKAIFYHHELITDEEGRKLSKSAGSVSIQHLRKNGKKKEEVYQLLATMTGLPATGIYNWETFGQAYFAEH